MELAQDVAVEWLLGSVAVSLVLALVAIRGWRVRRSAVRRLHGVVLRLEEDADLHTRQKLDTLLGRLEHGVDRAIITRGEADVSVNRLRQAIDAIPHGVVVCDDSATIVARNKAAEAFSGGGRVDVVVAKAVDELLRGALDGRSRQRTLELYGPPRRVLLVSATALDTGWRVGGAIAVVEDVSEQRRVDAMRRDFVANVSHELKTPVGALGLLAETIAEEPDSEVVGRLARRLQREAERVANTIDDLLDLSRIEAQESPDREPLSVSLVVAEAMDAVRQAALARSITIEEVAGPSLTIVGDRRQLVSAVFHLLENAVKYSDDGQAVQVSSTADDGWVSLTVRDHGVGIPPADMERIFERFYRVDRGRSRQSGGTGLGLSIVRHVVTNHGGEVRVESHEGEGSRFTLRLPLAPTEAGLRPAAG